MAVAAPLDSVDLDRYPISSLHDPEGRRLVDRCRSDLARQGACDLPGFLRPQAIERIVQDATALRDRAHRTESTHNIEFSGTETELAEDDPLRIQVRSAKSAVACDLFAEDSALRRLYESDDLTRFVSAALEVDPIDRQDDPVGAVSAMFYDRGDELGWHFDNADFVVTLMLRPSEAGGVFEYVPMLRTEQDRNPEGVRRLLAGDPTGVRTMSGEAGTLALFRGHLSPHRVTPVLGETARLNAVLSYARTPDARMSAAGRRLFYGRGR